VEASGRDASTISQRSSYSYLQYFL
jgi:hypothetical protein